MIAKKLPNGSLWVIHPDREFILPPNLWQWMESEFMRQHDFVSDVQNSGGYVNSGELFRLGKDDGYTLPESMVRKIQMEGLTEGEIVHFVLASGPCEGEHRPAMVVRVKRNDEGVIDPAGVCDLRVLTRGMELDGYPDFDLRTGIVFSETPTFHTWHWVERA